MDPKPDNECFVNTYFDGPFYEFSGPAIPVTDEMRARPLFGRPSPEELEERAREAKRFLESLNEPPAPPKDDESSNP